MNQKRVVLVAAIAALLALGWLFLDRSDSVDAPTAPEIAPRVDASETIERPAADARIERVERQLPNVAPRSATLHFVDEHDAPVPSARFARVDDGVERALGVANEAAELVLDSALVLDRDCIARAEGHRPTLVHVPGVFEHGTIVLESLASISGFVRMRDGSPPASTFTVVASVDTTRPSCAEVTRPSSSLHCAKTDASGFFRIDGLDRSRTYCLTGAGSGYLVSRQAGVAPSPALVQLDVRSLYGVRFVMVDAQGGPLAGPPELYVDQSLEAYCADPKLESVNQANELLLAGITGADCVEDEPQDSITMLYAGDAEWEQVGPVRISIARPGYRRAQRSVLAERVRDSVLQAEVRMIAEPVPCGSIEIRVVPPEFIRGAELGVTLRGASGSTYTLALSHVARSPYVIQGVPSDEYTYEVRGMDKLIVRRTTASGAPLGLSVLPERTAVLEIDLSQERSLTIELVDELGLAFEGPVDIRLRNESGHRGLFRQMTLESPPYHLLGIGEGEYSLAAMRRLSGGKYGEEPWRSRIVVGPESEQRVVLTSRFRSVSELR